MKKQISMRTTNIVFAANKYSGLLTIGEMKSTLADAISQYKDADSIMHKFVWKVVATTTALGVTVTPVIVKSRTDPSAQIIAADNVYTEINDLLDSDLAVDYTADIGESHCTFQSLGNESAVYYTRFEIDLTKKAKQMIKMYNKGQTPAEDFTIMLALSCSAAAQTINFQISQQTLWDIVPRKPTSSNILTPT